MAQDLTLIYGPGEIMYSRNPIWIKLETTRTDTMVILDVYDSNSNRLVYLVGRPDSNKRVSFEISNILDVIVKFHKPDINSDVNKVSETVQNYYCIANEVDNELGQVSSLNIGWDGTTASLWVIKGGVNAENHSGSFPLSYLKTQKKFNTWLNKNIVLPNQPLFLFYLHQYDSEDIDIIATLHFSDATSTSDILQSVYSVDKYDFLAINAGYLANELDADEAGKTTISYEITIVEHTSQEIRAQITNYLQNEQYFQPVYILNANSLGGLDAHYFEGNKSTEKKAEKTQTEVAYENISKYEETTSGLTHTVTVNTGHKSKEEIVTLTEILINNHNFEVINSTLIKITIDKTQNINILGKNNLQGTQIKYSRIYNNINFTPDEFIS